MLGRDNPAVGLLSIGEEPEKGNAVTKEAHALLRTGLNFIGNIEGRDLPKGGTDHHSVDVVVCDGFVGNVLLKFYEGIAPLMIETLRSAGVDSDAARRWRSSDLDYSEYGGAPLLGVRGVSIIAHGKSSPRAIKNAIRVAVQAVTSGMNDIIGERLNDTTESAA